MICSCVTTNGHLKKWIASTGQIDRCDYCSVACRPTVHIERLAQHIDGVLREHYSPDPDGNGEDPTELIQRLAGVDAKIAELAQSVVHDDENYG